MERVRESLLRVKRGTAAYERDSVLFDRVEYAWELLAALMWVAARHKGQLRLIDFGGSLGSSYYQNRSFLQQLDLVSWNIVEQTHFVEVGKRDFESHELYFFSTMSDCLSVKPIDCVLLSSVLQYLSDPLSVIDEICRLGIETVVVDRCGFTLDGAERITVQRVPEKIYKASYPCRFFVEEDFVALFTERGYELIADFQAMDAVNVPSVYKGFIFNRKS